MRRARTPPRARAPAPRARPRRRGAAPPQPRVKAWVVFADGTKLGEGRARLFQLIDELGSLKQAVARMGMSYRAAWGYIRELEGAAGFPFLTRKPGGGARGAHLTPEGRAFLDRYRRFRRSLDRLAARRFGRAFADD